MLCWPLIAAVFVLLGAMVGAVKKVLFKRLTAGSIKRIIQGCQRMAIEMEVAF
jgi:hypothetical protein